MAIVKGLRAISDFEYELEMNQLNRRQAPEIESVYLMASAKYSFLSSSGIKELATFGGDIDDLVPERGGRRLEGTARPLTKQKVCRWTSWYSSTSWTISSTTPSRCR